MKGKHVLILIGLAIASVLLVSVTAPDSASMDEDEARELIREHVPEGTARAFFAPGCFWCTEALYQETEGVTNAISGYAGGVEFNPTYEEVYKDLTGHREAVAVYYEPDQISYEELVDLLFRNIDPTDPGGQFTDRGFSYTTAIFYETQEQFEIANNAIAELEASGTFNRPIVTPVIPFTTFYQAEDYHQDFYLKSPQRYKEYEGASGRQEFREIIWSRIQEQEESEQ